MIRIQYYIKKTNVPCPEEFYSKNEKLFQYLESITITHYIMDLRKIMTVSIDAEKAFDKIKHALIIK